MAKGNAPVPQGELKKILDGLYKAIQTTSSSSKEQVRINRELMKVMSLIQSGFTANAKDAHELIATVRDQGFAITDEFISKWAKERKISKDDLGEIIRRFREIETMNNEAIDSSKNYNDLLKKRISLTDDELDLSSQILKTHEDIAAAVAASKSQLDAFGSGLDKVNEISKLAAKSLDFGVMFDDNRNSLTGFRNSLSTISADIDSMISNASGNFVIMDLKFNPLTGELDDEVKKVMENVAIEKQVRLDGLRAYFAENEKLQKNITRQMAAQKMGLNVEIDLDFGHIKTATGVIQEGGEEFDKMAKKLDKIAKKSGMMDKLTSSFNEITDLISKGSNLTEEQYNRYVNLTNALGPSVRLLADAHVFHVGNLDAVDAEITKYKEAHVLMAKYNNKLMAAETIVRKIGDSFDYINSILPSGMGEFLGLSRVSASLIESHRKGVQTFADGLKNGSGFAKSMNGYLKGFGPSIALALNPLALMAIAAALLFKFASDITSKYKEMATEMKISLGQAKELHEVQIDTLTSQKNQFATMKDIQDVQTSMIGSSGKVFDLTNKGAKDLSINLVEVGKYFGYGTDQAVQMHKIFERLGADDDLAIQLQRNVGHMSEMAGLSPQIVSQDLIDSAEEVSMYFAGMPEQAAAAAVGVRKMGMSLKQAGSIAKEMMNLEGFMTNMYELQAMTNGGVDFSKAFDKGLMGDIQGMTKEIMENIGTTAEFNNMDHFTRMKIANTLGMSVDDLGKSVMLHEKMNGLNEKDQSYLQANLDRMGDISMLSQEDVKNKLASLQSTDRLGVAWDKIKGVLVKSLLPLVESLADGIDAIMPILDILIFGLKGIASIIKNVIAPAINLILIPTKMFGELLGMGTSKLDEMGDGFTSVGSGIGELVKMSAGLFTLWAAWKGYAKFKGMSFSAKEASTEVVKASTESMTSVSSAAAQTTSTVSANIQTTVAKTAKATTDMAAQASASVEKVKRTSNKGGGLSIINPGTAKKTFGVLGDIASKTFGIMAVRSAMSFMNMKKDGEEQTSQLADSMGGIMDMAFMGGSSLLVTYLQDGVEKVFSKKIEKRIEGGLEGPIKRLSKRFGSLEKPASASFDKITEKGKGAFSKIAAFAKSLLPSSVSAATGSFDALSDKIEPLKKIKDVIPTDIEQLKNPKKTISDKVEPPEKIKDKILEKVQPSRTMKPKSVKGPIEDVAKQTGSGFSSLTNIMKTVWDGLKTVLNDIVKFVSDSMKTLSGAIGETIKNILKGIGDGLSSFKTSALKGAASLLILSGALWITSKAVQNFTTVKWEDMAKAGVALGGLALIALTLGSASPAMLLGAASIAVLGAALIPAAYAFGLFSDIEWSDMAKAGVAIVGLGIAASVLAPLLPVIALGSVAIAALGASVIPLAAALNIAAPAIDTVFGSLASIDVGQLMLIGPALGMIGVGLAAMAVGASSMAISNFFGGSVTEDLEKLGNLADPLYVVKNTIEGLNDALFTLAETMADLELQNIDKLSKITKVGIDSEIKQKISPLAGTFNGVERDNTNVKVSPVQTPIAAVGTPRKSSVAQDKKIGPMGGVATRDEAGKTISSVENNFNSTEKFTSERDIYNEDTVPDNLETNLLLKQMVQLMQILVKKDPTLVMDGQRVNAISKKYNNK